MEVSGQPHALAALPLGKEPPLVTVQGAGWAPELVWMFGRSEKSLTIPGSEYQIVLTTVHSLYYAILAPQMEYVKD